MTISTHTLARTLCLPCLGLVWLSLGCKDDSPCDEGQEEHNAACYPATAAGSGSGSAGSGGDTDTGDIDGSGGTDPSAPAAVQAEVGQTCADTTAFSDCGGHAPICAPLPSGTACTQILCLPGEANAGACPSGWTCLQARPMPDPSVCLKF